MTTLKYFVTSYYFAKQSNHSVFSTVHHAVGWELVRVYRGGAQ